LQPLRLFGLSLVLLAPLLCASASSGTGQESSLGSVFPLNQDGQPLLIRAIGPTLADFQVARPLPNPHLTLFSGQTSLETNDDWGKSSNAEAIASASASLGAFALPESSLDAALFRTFAASPYTLHVRGAQGDRGVVLVELYNSTARQARLVNLSARADAGAGENVLIMGFHLSGRGARTLLLRAVGPSLHRFGVTNPLATPQLTLYEGDTPLLANEGWSTSPDADVLRQTAGRVGAFALDEGSRDAALLVTLMPGTYTVHARGIGGSVGNVLVEAYAVP
jgi:hypothetical protein